MMLYWTEEMIRFMSDASEYSDYFVKLADFIEPYLKGKTICDAGCGLGQLSKELGKRGYLVYACDKSEVAINYVKSKNYENVVPVNCDLETWRPSFKFDSMIFNYFGSMEQIVKISSYCCKDRVITLKKNYRFHRFSFTTKPISGHMSETAEKYLERNGIKFEVKEFSSEFGQPFKSLEDAVRFFQIYSKDDDKSLITEENVLRLLKKINHGSFIYYLPKVKPSLMFILGVNDESSL